MNQFIKGTPPLVKNLLLINVVFYIGTFVLAQMNIDLVNLLGLHYFKSADFNPIQYVTYMFLHSPHSFMHIFFNMFALWMFGRILEQVWGSKRFLVYYMITGIGAAIIQTIVLHIEVTPVISSLDAFINNPSVENLNLILSKDVLNNPRFFGGSTTLYNNFVEALNHWKDMPSSIEYKSDMVNVMMSMKANFIDNHVTIGASGAVFGILLAFGMLFPNSVLMLLFPPIPIKAKYFVIIYGVLELFLGVASFSKDNVAHFAHLGGMLFGYLLIRYWKNKKDRFY